MGIRSYHLDRDSVLDEHVPAGQIPWGDLKDLKVGTVTVDPPEIGAGNSANVDVTVTGLTTAHRVVAMCQADLEAGLVPQAAYVSAADTLRIRLGNPTLAAIDGDARLWFYIAWIP